MWSQAFLYIWQDQARPVGIYRSAGKMCLHSHEGELCHLQESKVTAWDVCITLCLMAPSTMGSFGFVWPSWAQVGGDSISLPSTGQTAASLTKALCCPWTCFTFLLGDTSGTSFLVFKFIVSALPWLCAPNNSACCSPSDVRKRFFYWLQWELD